MRYLTFSEQELPSYPLCLLIPTIQKAQIQSAYIEPHGLDPDELLVLTTHHSGGKKTPMKEMVAYITEELAPVLTDMQVEYLLVANSEYFKALTKAPKVEANLGYVMDCAFGPWKVVYVPDHRQIFYDPDKIKSKISLAIEAVKKHRLGNYERPGASIIRFAAYPETPEDIEQWLERLIIEDRPLTCDIEGFSLKHHTAGIGTISFSWSKHEGIAFPVDYEPIPGATEAPFGNQTHNARVRQLLLNFFLRFKQKITYHSIAYDAYVLIYQLFMQNILDTEGMHRGMEVMLRDWDDTKLIAYLATNSCAGNNLKLKSLAQEFAGNYAVEDIEDITRIPLPELLQYNLVDTLSTWFVKERYWDQMVADQQLDIYQNLFQPATWDIIQMQLTGMPVDMNQVKKIKPILVADEKKALDAIAASPLVQKYIYKLQEAHVAKRNSELKKKRITLSDPEVALVTFNPNSAPQLQELLYEVLGLPIIARSDSKLPSTKGKVLASLINHTDDQEIKDLLAALVDYKAVVKILNDFIPSLENAAQGPDGWHYLFGNFNLGGTLSGRLSSSDPNLQNLPSTGSRYAKLIKSCFVAPPGWLLVGLDFDSLEDKISALTTKDPNKLKVYTDGYDGHSLRAYAYWPHLMPDIDPTSVESINSIQVKYKSLRQKSKVPTFALTYDGTYNTLMTGSGLPMDQAKAIEKAYHELYEVSDQWVAAKLDEAAQTGYVTVAFGLRVRTPLLKQTIRKTSRTPYEAEAEGRSAGNALGQSWCLLNSRAGVEFNRIVRKSRFRHDIRPCSQIHDAQYFIIRDDISAVAFTNEHLVKATRWQEHPDIQHDEVKLGGQLSIFYPSWNEEITLPNGAGESEIISLIDAHLAGQKAT